MAQTLVYSKFTGNLLGTMIQLKITGSRVTVIYTPKNGDMAREISRNRVTLHTTTDKEQPA